MAKGTKVKSISTGWQGVVTMPGKVIVQVKFQFLTNVGKSSLKSAWRVADLLEVTA